MKKIFTSVCKILTKILVIVSFLDIIIGFPDRLKKIHLFFTGEFNNIEIYGYGQIIQLLGFGVVISGILIYMWLIIVRKYEPKRSLVDIIAPILLSDKSLEESENKFDKRFVAYRLIKVGIVFLIVGFVFFITSMCFSK